MVRTQNGGVAQESSGDFSGGDGSTRYEADSVESVDPRLLWRDGCLPHPRAVDFRSATPENDQVYNDGYRWTEADFRDMRRRNPRLVVGEREDPMELAVRYVGIDIAVCNALEKREIYTVGQLVKASIERPIEEDIMFNIKNIGSTRRRTTYERLKKLGVQIPQDRLV